MLLVLILALCVNVFATDYTIPQPKFQFLKTSGFKASIPDEDGIQLFAFHANVNKKMEHLEAGQISGDVVRKKDGKWVYEKEKIKLRDGDVIYYWIFVIKKGRGYTLDDGVLKVNGINGFYKKNSQYKRNKRHSFYPSTDESGDEHDHSYKPYNFRYFNNHGSSHHHRGDLSTQWMHSHNYHRHHDWPEHHDHDSDSWPHKMKHKCNHHHFDQDDSDSSEEIYTTERAVYTSVPLKSTESPKFITTVSSKIIKDVVETSTFPLIDLRIGTDKK